MPEHAAGTSCRQTLQPDRSIHSATAPARAASSSVTRAPSTTARAARGAAESSATGGASARAAAPADARAASPHAARRESCRPEPRAASATSASWCQHRTTIVLPLWINLEPVSYTHLTLPTILLV